MSETIPAATVRQNFSKISARVHKGHTRVLIERNGEPFVALISAADFERFTELEADDNRRLARAVSTDLKGRDWHKRTRLIYQLKVRLRGVHPAPWRQILVPGGVRLDVLHLVIQVVMGWENQHCYEFRGNGFSYQDPESAAEDGGIGADEVCVAQLASRPGARLVYEYDFGDSWTHSITVEAIGEPEGNRTYPVCLDGTHACPPEDCGGPEGFAELRLAARFHDHPEHEQAKEWAESFWQKRSFELTQVNDTLDRVLTYQVSSPELGTVVATAPSVARHPVGDTVMAQTGGGGV